MTRKELLDVPRREWDDEIVATGVYVFPSRRKHESGFACFDFVADTENGKVRFGGICDDVSFAGEHFRMDCILNPTVIHIWNSREKFKITRDISSISFIEGDY